MGGKLVDSGKGISRHLQIIELEGWRVVAYRCCEPPIYDGLGLKVLEEGERCWHDDVVVQEIN